MTIDNPAFPFSWHYAPLQYLAKMISSGALKPSNTGASSEQPLLWFSANQRWEPTATKMVSTAKGPKRMTFAEQERRFGAMRFGIASDDPRLMNWTAACEFAGTSLEQVKSMEAAGRELGAKPGDWFATGVDVQLAGLRFEVWRDSRWQEDGPQKLIDQWASLLRVPSA